MNTFLRTRFAVIMAIALLVAPSVQAQYLLNSDSAFKSNAPMTGRLWGYAFGDYYYKAHSDSLMRGGSNQYTGIDKDENAFALRRVYLGYDFNISRHFSTELLLAAEDNATRSNIAGTTSTSGDLLSDNKYTFYIKLVNIRWKNIWRRTDLVIGQVATPAFSKSSEVVWGYRSVERTIADIRRTPSFDLGITLQGKLDRKENYGYDLMIGNGTSAKPENDKFKWFYGDVWAKFMDKKLTVQLYADYERLNWENDFHHSRNMIKAFVGYDNKLFSAGIEAFLNRGKEDVVGMAGNVEDTLDASAAGISAFVHGNIINNKLSFFARIDLYNPDTKYEDQKYTDYKGLSSNFDPNTREEFITAGLDFTPVKNMHFMPNVWYNGYHGQESNLSGVYKYDYDLVYRVTFYYVFGK